MKRREEKIVRGEEKRREMRREEKIMRSVEKRREEMKREGNEE